MDIKRINKTLYKTLYTLLGFFMILSFAANLNGNEECLILAIENVDTVVSLLLLLFSINYAFVSSESIIYNQNHLYMVIALTLLFNICFIKVPGAFKLHSNISLGLCAIIVFSK